MRGLERLRRAKERLEGTDGGPAERLRQAACEFVIAATDRESWPIGLRIDAERVRAGLLAYGIVDGGEVDLDAAAVTEMSDDLRSVCERAERRFPSPRRPASPRRARMSV